MPSKRRLKNPDRYASPSIVAYNLRQLADDVEKYDRWISFNITLYFADESEVVEALKREAEKSEIEALKSREGKGMHKRRV